MNLIKSIENGTLNINDFHNQNNFIERILRDMSEDKIIGQGAVGSVYLVANGKYIVKKIAPCRFNKDLTQYKYCTDIQKLIEGAPMTLIPGGNGKYRYILPNLLSEIAIGTILGKMSDDLKCIHFTKTLGSFILSEQSELFIYIIMEPELPFVLKNTLNPKLQINAENPKTFFYFLFQVAHSLLQAQQKYLFTHYDLHPNNILWSSNKNVISYPLPNVNLRLKISNKDCPFIVKIADFGLSRLERKNYIISSTVDTFPENNYAEFSPSYDIISFIGGILFSRTNDPPQHYLFDSVLRNLSLYRIFLKFILWMLNDDEIIFIDNPTFEDLNIIRNRIGEKYYTKFTNKYKVTKYFFRPKKVEDKFLIHFNCKSMVEIVNYLGGILIKYKLAVPTRDVENPNMVNITRLSFNYSQYNNIFSYNKDILTNETITNDIDFPIKVVSSHVINYAPPNDFNFTMTKKQYDKCPVQDHYMTAIIVYASKLGNYNFSLDCCKLDPANYLRLDNKIGFVINGGYFNISADFLPMGDFKDDTNTIEKYEIPEKYRDVFRYVNIQNNVITIDKEKKGESYFASGPILIEDNKIVFSPYENRFACEDPKNVSAPLSTLDLNETDIIISGHIKYSSNENTCSAKYIEHPEILSRCDKIKPAELSHADNPNPRSALCILSNGDYVFLTIEGREKRGIGVDLYTLSHSILQSYPNVKTAINLDGGRSTNMAWRSVYEPDKVYVSNPDHMFNYPVGNILSLTRPF